MIPTISMWSLDRAIQSTGLTQSGFLHWAALKKLKYVELVSYYMNQENNLAEIINLLKELNLKVSCYTILTDFSSADSESETAFIKDLDAAQALGSPYVRILAGGEYGDGSEVKTNIVSRIKEAAHQAEKRNIVLILENIGSLTVHSNEALEIVSSVNSKSVKINFDTANPLLADESPLDALTNLINHTGYVHFKDFITEKEKSFGEYEVKDTNRIQISKKGIRMTGITTGKGVVPLKEMILMLKKVDYDGFVSIEYEGTGDSLLDTENSLNYLKSLI